MTRLSLLVVAAAVLAIAVAAPAQARIVPGKGMAGIRIGMTQAQVTAVLGQPDSSKTVSDDFGPSLRLRYASHGGLRLILRENVSGEQELFQVLTKGRVERTKRGVGVGTRERRLRRRLRGEHCETISGYRSCTIGQFVAGRIVTDFRIRRHRVVSVVVGRVVD
jgi:hypothetical protein